MLSTSGSTPPTTRRCEDCPQTTTTTAGQTCPVQTSGGGDACQQKAKRMKMEASSSQSSSTELNNSSCFSFCLKSKLSRNQSDNQPDGDGEVPAQDDCNARGGGMLQSCRMNLTDTDSIDDVIIPSSTEGGDAPVPEHKQNVCCMCGKVMKTTPTQDNIR